LAATDAVNRLIKRIGERVGFPFKVHVHMLRHACGYALANAGHDTWAIQDWLGHRAIQHTARYTELSQEDSKIFGAPDVSARPTVACREQNETNTTEFARKQFSLCCVRLVIEKARSRHCLWPAPYFHPQWRG
jgi:hypothetical protein